jgi:hypothetical protein
VINGQIKCYGCGASVETSDGATHKYIGAAAGCWAIYGEILAKEYSNPSYFYPAHRLTADTYAVQHPGVPGRQATQSVYVHLAGLYLTLENNLDAQKIPKIMSTLTEQSENFVWLEPPVPNGKITVLDVAKAIDAEEHQKIVREWAEDVWQAWATHHPKIKQLVGGFTS